MQLRQVNPMQPKTQRAARLTDGMAYVHSTATDIRATFARHGFKPTTDAERAKRNAKHRGE